MNDPITHRRKWMRTSARRRRQKGLAHNVPAVPVGASRRRGLNDLLERGASLGIDVTDNDSQRDLRVRFKQRGFVVAEWLPSAGFVRIVAETVWVDGAMDALRAVATRTLPPGTELNLPDTPERERETEDIDSAQSHSKEATRQPEPYGPWPLADSAEPYGPFPLFRRTAAYIIAAGTRCRIKRHGFRDWQDHVTESDEEFDTPYRVTAREFVFFRVGWLLRVSREQVETRDSPIGHKW